MRLDHEERRARFPEGCIPFDLGQSLFYLLFGWPYDLRYYFWRIICRHLSEHTSPVPQCAMNQKRRETDRREGASVAKSPWHKLIGNGGWPKGSHPMTKRNNSRKRCWV